MPNRDWGPDEDEEWAAGRWPRPEAQHGWVERGPGRYERWHGRSIAERAIGDRGAYQGDHRQPDEPERWGGTYAPGQYEPHWRSYYQRRPLGRAPRGYQRSDERIKEDLCDRLMHSWVDASDVEIDVRGGEVLLGGMVDDRASKRAVEDFADEILGVKDVQNNIRIRPIKKPTA
jgi:hypothetical protein